MNIRMVLRTLGYVLGAESALLLLPLLTAALYRENPVPFLIPLLALGTVSELGLLGLDDNLAGGLGMIALLVLVAVAVVLFMQCGAAVREYEFLEKEPIETEHGVTALVRERRAAFAPEYDRANRIGAALCILAAVPLFAAVMVGVSFLMSMSICLLLVLVACGVYAFVRVGTVQDAMDRLLEDGDLPAGTRP